jgi:hypothetical protein
MAATDRQEEADAPPDITTQCRADGGCSWLVYLPETRCPEHGGDPAFAISSTDAFGITVWYRDDTGVTKA